MNKRFTDNVTPLNAETLNGLEEDLKRYFPFPLYEAKYAREETTHHVYNISELEWSEIPVGKIFAVTLDRIPQSETNKIFTLSFGDSDTGYKSVFNYAFKNNIKLEFSYVGELSANRVYFLIKLAERGGSTPLIGLIDNIDTSKFGSSVEIADGKINLKNVCDAVISSADLPYGVEGAPVPKATQTVVGGAKMWVTGTTLNISTK